MTTSASKSSAVVLEGARANSRPSFIGRTLASISESIERDLLAEELAARPGWLPKLDPRAKVLGSLALILSVGLVRHLPVLLIVYLGILGIGLAGRIPAGVLVRRVWLALPFFTAVVAVPAIFSFVTPGPALVSFGHLGSTPIAITAPGARTALTLVFRVAASVSAVLLLVLTTRWPVLLKALRVLRLPQVFTLILAMTYRYVFLLAHVANSMFLARKSRTVGPVSGAQSRRWLAATTGSLLGKSYHLSNEVYLAMIARGFQGEPPAVAVFRFRGRDYLAVAGCVAVAAIFLLADHYYAGPW